MEDQEQSSKIQHKMRDEEQSFKIQQAQIVPPASVWPTGDDMF